MKRKNESRQHWYARAKAALIFQICLMFFTLCPLGFSLAIAYNVAPVTEYQCTNGGAIYGTSSECSTYCLNSAYCNSGGVSTSGGGQFQDYGPGFSVTGSGNSIIFQGNQSGTASINLNGCTASGSGSVSGDWFITAISSVNSIIFQGWNSNMGNGYVNSTATINLSGCTASVGPSGGFVGSQTVYVSGGITDPYTSTNNCFTMDDAPNFLGMNICLWGASPTCPLAGGSICTLNPGPYGEGHSSCTSPAPCTQIEACPLGYVLSGSQCVGGNAPALSIHSIVFLAATGLGLIVWGCRKENGKKPSTETR